MKTVALAVAVSLAFGGSASAAERDATVFEPFLTEDSAKCVSMADVAKVGKLIDLSLEQFQFARAFYVAIPPVSKKFPPGDRAVIAGASDGTAMVAIVDADKSCARFLAPNFVLQMLNDIKAGKVEHAGDPT
jgi:hypothetical protein